MDSHSQRRLARIWSFYCRNRSERLRQVLTEHYLPLVNRLARKLAHKLPSSVQLDELVSGGILGLLDALDSYSLDRQTKFETFSARRITGAMIDELRAIDPVSRNTRAAARKLASLSWQLQCTLGRPATDRELAEAMGLTMENFVKLRQLVRAASLVSLDRPAPDTGTDQSCASMVADERLPDPASQAQRRVLREWIVQGLSREERLIIILYYYENLTLAQIGKVLDISESRVSQIRSSIIKRFKAKWKKRTQVMEAIAA